MLALVFEVWRNLWLHDSYEPVLTTLQLVADLSPMYRYRAGMCMLLPLHAQGDKGPKSQRTNACLVSNGWPLRLCLGWC